MGNLLLYLLSRSAHKVSNLNTHPQISFKPDDIKACSFSPPLHAKIALSARPPQLPLFQRRIYIKVTKISIQSVSI